MLMLMMMIELTTTTLLMLQLMIWTISKVLKFPQGQEIMKQRTDFSFVILMSSCGLQIDICKIIKGIGS
jgi:hypothetical protein